MRKKPMLFGIHAEPPRVFAWILLVIPFVLLLVAYEVFSSLYLANDPGGKIMPSFGMMGTRIWNLGFTLDPRTHTYLLWGDTLASLMRLLIGLVLAAATGLLLGVNLGLFPGMRYLLLPLVIGCSFIPMMALLPILLIVLGIGEVAKIALIFLGLVFFITRDLYATTREVPEELLVKARTLGSTELELVYQVVLPMVMPRLLETTRQALGAAWLFLITGEAIAASEGIAYRIYLARRTQDMAAIIPYVLWMTLLAATMYYILLYAEQLLYPWKTPRSRQARYMAALFSHFRPIQK